MSDNMNAAGGGDAGEPRALSMSLDEIIKEKRGKEGFNSHRNSKHTRGGAHFVPNRTGGKQNYNSRSEGQQQTFQHKHVRVHYAWDTADTGIESLTVTKDSSTLIKISSSGDVLLHSDIPHEWPIFSAMNTCLVPVGLKMIFDKDITEQWTVKNAAGWNRLLDTNITVSAFPGRQWEVTKHALNQLPESISLQPKHHHQPQQQHNQSYALQPPPFMSGAMGPGFPMAMSGGAPMNPMMNPMVMMMMMAQQQRQAAQGSAKDVGGQAASWIPVAAVGAPYGSNISSGYADYNRSRGGYRGRGRGSGRGSGRRNCY